jgi:hypothetical protein
MINWIIKLLFIVLFIASCCDDDKVCPDAQINNFKSFPFKEGDNIKYKDTTGNLIEIVLNTTIKTSIGQTYKGSCSALRPSNNCEQSIQLNSKNINTSGNLLFPYQKYFSMVLSKTEIQKNTEYFSFSALGFEYSFYGVNYYDSISNSRQYNKLSTYKTPYKTYTNVYVRKIDETSNNKEYQRKLVIDSKARIISFGLNTDTLNLFHLVE